jgi:hypothetical protein
MRRGRVAALTLAALAGNAAGTVGLASAVASPWVAGVAALGCLLSAAISVAGLSALWRTEASPRFPTMPYRTACPPPAEPPTAPTPAAPREAAERAAGIAIATAFATTLWYACMSVAVHFAAAVSALCLAWHVEVLAALIVQTSVVLIVQAVRRWP